MAKTKIDWCNEVWNPVWGCLHGCPFCYARKFARRFSKQVAQWNGVSKEDLREFNPTFLPKNFEKKLTGRIIFVNSMSDIAFWKTKWIEKVFKRIRQEKNRIFLFLTKAPESYRKFPQKLPNNVWLGISATDKFELAKRTKRLIDSTSTNNLFVSLEPLLSPIEGIHISLLQNYKWVIVGPLTGRKYHPMYRFSNSWVDPLKKFCVNRGIAFFVKEAAKRFGVELVREFPFQEAGNG